MLVCGLFASFALSSCLNDDDNNNDNALTRSDSIAAMTSVQGDYSGQLFYYNSEKAQTRTSWTDSVDVRWNVESTAMTYGTLTLKNFPMSVLGDLISSGSATSEVKEVLAVANNQSITTWCVPYAMNTNNSSTVYGFSIYPKTEETSFFVNLNGNSHSIAVKYATSMYFMSSYWYPLAAQAGRAMQGYVIISQVTVDGNIYKIESPLFFYGSK